MRIAEARKQVARGRLIGALLLVFAAALFLIAGLKGIYFSQQGDKIALAPLSLLLQRGVYFIYEHTQFASWLWTFAPTPTVRPLDTLGNYGFLLIASCLAIGRVIWDSADHLSSRIKAATKRVEEAAWEQELHAKQGRVSAPRPDVLNLNIELDQRDQWYKRPVGLVLLAIAGAVAAQMLNLSLGLAKL